MTNEELSRASGIPLGTLSKLLAGFSDSVKLSNIVSLCDALDCSIDYIVSGVPENTNNFTLDAAEIRMIEDYRRLDDYGRELVAVVVGKERERVTHASYSAPAQAVRPGIRRDAIIRRDPALRTEPMVAAQPPHRFGDSDAKRREKRVVRLYDLPVSAGPGEYLDGDSSETVTLSASEVSESIDYALRISGNSMEPKFRDGDILLVQNAESVEIGELGIFILDGNGYFKCFGGDSLISLNPAYGQILLKDFNEVSCVGRVIGKTKKR